MRAAAVIGALVSMAIVLVPPPTFAASCTRSCVARMGACRAERCPDATGTDRRRCRDVCRAVTGCAAGAARIRTLATVVNECHSAGGMWTGRERLEIRRGDCPPVTVMTVEASTPAVEILPVCAFYGMGRNGSAGVTVGALQRVAVSPDGATVVFEVTDDFTGNLVVRGVKVPSPSGTLDAEGIFVVHADGTNLRRIADQSREPPFAVRPDPGPSLISVVAGNGFDFSPDGKSVVFVDHGPGSDGSVARQLFTLDVVTGARRQVTTFTASQVGINPHNLLDIIGLFLDDRHIGGYIYDGIVEPAHLFTMARDGTDLRFIESPSPIPGATVVPDFGVIGAASAVFPLDFPEQTDQPRAGPVREVFLQSGEKMLQLTNFRRSDTGTSAIRLHDREHVMFTASADPDEGRNARHLVQLFRIDVLGGHVRQLTDFGPLADVPVPCTFIPPSRCRTPQNLGLEQDRATGVVVFDSSCDPLAMNPLSQQLYAMRPNGSGFRQLTSYRGVTCDGAAIDVELPGPIAYSAPAL